MRPLLASTLFALTQAGESMAECSPPSFWPGHEVGGVDCTPHPTRSEGRGAKLTRTSQGVGA